MTRRDALPLLLVTAVYAFVAFFHLGSLTNPQSWYCFEEEGTVLEFDLGQDMEIGRIVYYTGIGSGEVLVEVSLDGESYRDYATIDQAYNQILKWHELYPGNAEAEEGDTDWQAPEPVAARYLRLTCQDISSRHTGLYLGELAVYSADGTMADSGRISRGWWPPTGMRAWPCLTSRTRFRSGSAGRTAPISMRSITPAPPMSIPSAPIPMRCPTPPWAS